MFKNFENFRTSDQIITITLSKFWTLSRQSLVRTSGKVFTKKLQSEVANMVQNMMLQSEYIEAMFSGSEHDALIRTCGNNFLLQNMLELEDTKIRGWMLR